MPLLPEGSQIYKNTRELFETGSFPGHFGVLIFEIRRLSYFAQMREAPKSYSGSFDPGDLENVLTRRAPKLQLSHFAHILLTYKTQSMHVFKKLLSNLKFLSERNVL